MRKCEPWQHEWSTGKKRGVDGVEVKWCRVDGCVYEMLSRKNSNRYRNGPNGAWQHSPKDRKGSDS